MELNMFDGLWTVEFESTVNRYGQGVVVINNERILGGDDGYYYCGRCKITSKKIKADLAITRYNANISSVFGDLDHFSLTIQGELEDEYLFKARGTIANYPDIEIYIEGKKKEDL